MYKDRIMKHEEVLPYWSGRTLKIDELLEAQDKISFKAGEVEGYKQGLEMREPYKAGIKKVVDWVNGNAMIFSSYRAGDGLPVALHFGRDRWQSKLKEWGIDE